MKYTKGVLHMSDKMDFREIDEVENIEETQVELSDIPEDIDDSDDGYERYCFICHRPESKVGKFFDLPNNMSICSDCMQKSMDAMSNMPPIDFGNIPGMPNMPGGGGVQFLNLSDLDSFFPKQKKVKRKKE